MSHPTQNSVLLPALIVLALIAAFLGYQYWNTNEALTRAQAEAEVASNTTATLLATLSAAEAEKAQLADALETERERNDEFQDRIDEISGTVGKLDKLSQIDPELLQKYSKIYFLNDNYTPSALTLLPEKWTLDGQEEYFHKEAWPHLRDLLEAAEDDGINLRIVSGYRSFGTQTILKNGYTVNYGSGANAFSADQGYSEHQLGTTLDFTTKEIGGAWSSSLEGSEAFVWLSKNAYKHGFVLSYPKGNVYYVYEPWHWRFVGEKLADELHDDKKNFYDLDQRDIDTHLINFFD